MANRPTQSDVTSGWVGWGFFAAFMMMLSGSFQFLYGLVAILNDKYFVVTQTQLLVLDVTQWGWVQLIVGTLVFFAGVSLLSGSMYGRIVGVIMAFLSSLIALANLSTYPVWSVIVITIDVLVIFALTAHGSELQE